MLHLCKSKGEYLNFIKYILTLLLCLNFLYADSNTPKHIPAIVSMQWLQDNIKDPNLVIVDLRKSEEYNKLHIKNAVNIPGLKSLWDEKFFMPKLDYLKEILSNAGIDHNSKVVAYDNGDFVWAARFYWILEMLGHREVGIFKYGFATTLDKYLTLDAIAYIPNRKEFVPRIDNSKIQTKLSTLLSIGEKTIIDGRKKSHYEGKESFAKRYGHIPTAINYSCTQNYQVTQNGNVIKDFSELRKLYSKLPKNKEIILYCDGGAEAALNYIVLQELGFKASVYDGSWFEWGNDVRLPIINPSNEKISQ